MSPALPRRPGEPPPRPGGAAALPRTWHDEVHHHILAPGQVQRPAQLRTAVGARGGGGSGLGTLCVPVRVPDVGSRQPQEDVLRQAPAAAPALLQLQLQQEAAPARRVSALLHVHDAQQREAPARPGCISRARAPRGEPLAHPGLCRLLCVCPPLPSDTLRALPQRPLHTWRGSRLTLTFQDLTQSNSWPSDTTYHRGRPPLPGAPRGPC